VVTVPPITVSETPGGVEMSSNAADNAPPLCTESCPVPLISRATELVQIDADPMTCAIEPVLISLMVSETFPPPLTSSEPAPLSPT